MKFLTIEYIKAHSRICCDCEDGVLERLGTSAEQIMFELCARSYDDFINTYGQIPAPVVHATLELVENFYQHRGTTEPTSLSIVPYNFDLLVKPYIKLL